MLSNNHAGIASVTYKVALTLFQSQYQKYKKDSTTLQYLKTLVPLFTCGSTILGWE